MKSQAARSRDRRGRQESRRQAVPHRRHRFAVLLRRRAGQDPGESRAPARTCGASSSDFKTRGVDGVVLDMRDNPGGFLEEAIALAGPVHRSGPGGAGQGPRPAASAPRRSRRGRRLRRPADGAGQPPQRQRRRKSSPRTLQDYGRALIVGDRRRTARGRCRRSSTWADSCRKARPGKLGALRLTHPAVLPRQRRQHAEPRRAVGHRAAVAVGVPGDAGEGHGLRAGRSTASGRPSTSTPAW